MKSEQGLQRLMRLVVMVLCVSLVGGCEKEGGQGGDEGKQIGSYPYTIVVTTGMIADIVREVAGEHANVKGLIGEGVDPHLYTPTRNDVAALQKADVIFYNGLLLEGKMSDLFVRLAGKGRRVYAVTEGIDHAYLLEPEDAPGHHDPHVWMDVKSWIEAVKVVAEKLGEVDGEHQSDYEANAKRYIGELEKLEAYAKSTVGTIPEASRVLITAHDAFNYFGKAYEVEVLGIQGLSTESEAGLADINKLVDLLVKRNIKAVFAESSVSDDNIKALIEGAKSRKHAVSIGGMLFSDAMGEAGTYEGTYVGMIDHNVTTIVRALGGKAPEKGLNGKLGNLKHE